MVPPNVFGTIAVIFSFIIIAATWGQTWRVRKLKSSRDLSLPLLFAVVCGYGSWLLYGLRTRDMFLIVSQGGGFVSIIVLLGHALKYR